MQDLLLRILFLANVVVAGPIGVSCLFSPATAGRAVFSDSVANSHSLTVTGALWLAIAALSLLGLWFPLKMSPVLLLQLFYKSGWLLAIAIPWLIGGKNGDFPTTMAAFFLVWVVVLPFVIPWKWLVS